MPRTPSGPDQTRPRWLRGLCCLCVGWVLASWSAQASLEDFDIAGQFLSQSSYESLVSWLGGKVRHPAEGPFDATVPFTSVAVPLALFTLVTLLAGGWLISLRDRRPVSVGLADWAFRGWRWWLLPGAWEVLRTFAFASGLQSIPALLTGSTGLCWAVSSAGWLATFAAMCAKPETRAAGQTVAHRRTIPLLVCLAIIGYVTVYTTMNWQLYRGLLVPHGDSAMYEEHLWNLEHGKGFRSYLDRGLFLGEHIQVIHVLLVPLHLVWPSLMGMELCQSLALASGAIPVFWMARRHTGSAKAASLLSLAYVLYSPLQFLDISIDLKTFRPDSFGVPALLFALDQLERRRYASFSILVLLAFSAQEHFAVVVAPLGLWLALRPDALLLKTESIPSATIGSRIFGIFVAIAATAYFFIVLLFILPLFRGGADVHYVRYLSQYGNSAGELVKNLLFHPGMWLGDAINARTLLYSLFVVAPLGLVPLLSPGRLFVGLPFFVFALCLNELTPNDVYPRHHFHAALVPIVFWAAAAGLGNVSRLRNWLWRREKVDQENLQNRSQASLRWTSHFTWACALTTGMLISMGPLGRTFWDPGSENYWKVRYVPGKRAEMYSRIDGTIPDSSRVASTDFVHPRFTHYERSYDYSEFPRAVNNGKPGAPSDTDYIVIDTQHPYSKISRPEQISELRDHPDEWELLPNATEGYFIVLKRKAGDAGP